MLNLSDSVVTRQFGFIKFNEDEIDESTRPSQYIRLALDTKADKVVQFMKEAWRLRTPDLIISITGGAKYCDLSARLRKAFQVGLVSAAATTSKSSYNIFF
jgi:transient receptor potential cation channel subfamily M protein 8